MVKIINSSQLISNEQPFLTIILHGSTSQKTILNIILAAVRTWNLTWYATDYVNPDQFYKTDNWNAKWLDYKQVTLKGCFCFLWKQQNIVIMLL
jgi:hypothetical protein